MLPPKPLLIETKKSKVVYTIYGVIVWYKNKAMVSFVTDKRTMDKLTFTPSLHVQ
jgi:hypothetical protein